jgi:hypothetical protein
MPPPVYNFIALHPTEVPEGRAFCDPAHNTQDIAVLEYMRQALAERLAGETNWAAPATFMRPEADGRYHRQIICNASALRATGELAVVGFFGQRRPDPDSGPITRADADLVAEFSRHPEILSYSSIELSPGGDYGNLVVLARDSAREHWRESKTHQYVVSELSPNYYASIRLHSGVIPRGLLQGAVILARTKYYDYREGFWCGLRLYAQGGLDNRPTSPPPRARP